MNTVKALQWWGGLFYLFAKVILSGAKKEEFRRQAFGWTIYLIGVPAWVVLLASRHKWIAMTVEGGGATTIILGIYCGLKKLQEAPEVINTWVRVLVVVLVTLGIGYSIYDLGGINSFSQVLEFGVTAGYLIGSYLLFKHDRRGWLWYLLMNSSTAILTATQYMWILCVLQVASMYFAISGFRKAKKP